MLISMPLLLALAAGTPAPTHVTRLLVAPMQLEGWSATFETTFSTAGRQGDLELRLRMRPSASVDPARSQIVVMVDDTKVLGDRLIPSRASVLKRQLPRLPPGVHRLSVVVRAVAIDADCGQDDGGLAWLDLESIELERSESTPPAADLGQGTTLTNFPERWRNGISADVGISITGIAEHQTRWWLSVTYDYFLRDLTLLPRHRNPGPLLDANPRIALQRVHSVPLRAQVGQSPLVNQLLADPSHFALVKIENETLRIVAKEIAGFIAASHFLQSTLFRERCPRTGWCIVGPTAQGTNDPIEEMPLPFVSRGPTSLSSLGHPFGFTARAPGAQSMSFLFRRPSTWSVKGRVVVVLQLTIGVFKTGKPAHVTLNLAGRPLSSWELVSTSSTTTTLTANVPPHLLDETALLFTLEVVLPESLDACQEQPRRSAWIHVEPTSHIDFPREERLENNLQHYPDGAFKLNVDTNGISFGSIGAQAAALYSVHRNLPVQSWRVVASEDCNSPCVRLDDGSPAGSLTESVSETLIDSSGQRNLPALAARAIVVVSREANAKGDLSVRIPASNVWRVPVLPDEEALSTREAIRVRDSWSASNAPASVFAFLNVTGADVPDTTIVSEKRNQRRRADLFWFLGGLLVVGVSLVWIFGVRRSRRRNPSA